MTETTELSTSASYYPFLFFCEEYWDENEVTEMVMDGYKWATGDDTDALPSVGYMKEVMMHIFKEGLLVRMILCNDTGGDHTGLNTVLAENVREEFEGTETALKLFIRDYMETFNFYTRDPIYWENFAHDIRVVLDTHQLFYVDSETTFYHHVEMLNSKIAPSAPLKDILRNTPIVGVW